MGSVQRKRSRPARGRRNGAGWWHAVVRVGGSGPRGGLRGSADGVAGLVGRALRMPLYYKVLVANAVLVLAATAAATAWTAELVRGGGVRGTTELMALFGGLGVLASVAVNGVILRLALKPLRELGATAERVRGEDLEARVAPSRLADRELLRLGETFNEMLDSVTGYRRRLRDVAARALTVAEDERKRLAKELHDGTAQTLAALLIRLRLARGSSDERARDALLEEARAEIADAMEGIRRFARALRPPTLDELGLTAALEAHARMVAEGSDLDVALSLQPLNGVLTPEAELAAYRIVQEAISNVARHAGARRVTIVGRRTARGVELSVEDDGRGFDVASTLGENRGSLGLFGMRERALYAGGELHIESEPGSGTTVRLRLPRGERVRASA